MKLDEMADVLDGLATTLEKFLGKTAVSDMHALGNCLRQFSGETVAAFCTITLQAREGGSAAPRRPAMVNEGRVLELASRIQHFLDHRRECDYASIRQITSQIAKLKVPEIKAIGQRVGCDLTGRTKAALASSLENWLSDIKASAEQSAFTLTGVGN
jgi:hypothetical protein